jgi:hypothetical protein
MVQQASSQQAEPQAGGEMGEQGMHAVPVAGYFEIPIERTVIACAENPDSTVRDVIDQQRQANAGSDSSSG